MNLSVPEKERPKTHEVFAPWAHADQSPLQTNFDCVQGILNLLPNGPDDGGLMVLDGSTQHYKELWQHFDGKKGEKGWNLHAGQDLDEEMCQWLESKGCKWVKVCAQPGDLMLWDSVGPVLNCNAADKTDSGQRTVHYGAPPSSINPRFAACKLENGPPSTCWHLLILFTDVCYKPAATVSEGNKKGLLEAFALRQNSTHDPANFRTKPRLPPEDHPSYATAQKRPIQEPVLSFRGKQLAGLEAY